MLFGIKNSSFVPLLEKYKQMKTNPLYYLIIALLLSISCDTNWKNDPYISWQIYRGDEGSNAYSKLAQINKENVKNLQVAWVYRTGDKASGTIQCNPIIIGDTLFAVSASLKVFALDAASGKKIWEYNPASDGEKVAIDYGGSNRGLTYWEDGEDKRLFYSVLNELKALNATSGKPIASFGNDGAVDLREGLDRDFDKETAYIRSTSPGVIYNDLIITGSTVAEESGGLPGHIRAYDVRSGELAWIFHTIPHPGEFGYHTWPEDYYKTGGGANVWGGFSIDQERGIVFAPTGAPTHDFYGGDRKGKGLFGNSLLALNAQTGEYIWHFQVSHHDLWDYDIPCPPNLVSIQHEGKTVEAVAQLTKQGFIFLLDRETGKPIYPIEERFVRSSHVEGEVAWPMQPFPVKPPPLVRHYFDESLVTDISPESHQNIMQQIKGYTLGGIYTPPSIAGTIQLPGFRGGGEWSGAAFDPETGKMYIGVNDMPHIVQLVEDVPQNEDISEFEDLAAFGQSVYMKNCASCHGEDRKGNISHPSLIHIKDSISLTTAKMIVEKGAGMMPSFQRLQESHRRAILAYLFELDNKEAKERLPLEEKQLAKEALKKDRPKRYKLKAYKQLRDQEGYPGIKPPWGNLCAVNLNTAEIEWKVPLGEYEALTKRGIPPTGTQLFGGGIVTAGGLIFIGATRDEKFRAFDKDTGEILWEFQLPVGGYATPATYAVGNQQYVVIAAGGGGMQGTKSGDYYYAFKLPDSMEKNP